MGRFSPRKRRATGTPPPVPPPAARSADYEGVASRWSALSRFARGGLTALPGDPVRGATVRNPVESAPELPVPRVRWDPTPASTPTTTPSMTPTPTPDRSRDVLAVSPPDRALAPLPTPPRSPAISTRLSDYGSPANALRGSCRWDFSELTALKQKFIELDKSGKGVLSRSAFHRLFSSIVDVPDGVDATEASPLFNFAYSLFDSSETKGLNLKEFVGGCWILSHGSEEERLKYLFHMYDADNTGKLNVDELKNVLRIMRSYAAATSSSAPSTGGNSSNEDARRVLHSRHASENLDDLARKTLAQHDRDLDGEIAFQEFAAWCACDPIVKTWMDMLCFDTARGVERLREEREKELLAKELDSLGLGDLWRESIFTAPVEFSLNNPGSSSGTVVGSGGDSSIQNRPKKEMSSDTDSMSVASQLALPPAASSGASASSASEVPFSRNASTIGFEIDFNDLTFVKKIGSGSFATVYECIWLDSPVAVKVFKAGPKLVLNDSGGGCSGSTTTGAFDDEDESFEPELDSMSISRRGDEMSIDDPSVSQRVARAGEQESFTEGRSRFLQEISLLAAIRHPNVMLYLGACVDPQHPLCIVSELIDGGSLHECLHGPQPLTLTLVHKMRLTQDIARGMLYLHSTDPLVLHRDLKSANVLVERQSNNQLKATIIDFGLSRLSSSTQASLQLGGGGALCGSLVTMAPEIMGSSQYLTRADVYSFGVLVWEIFTSRIPFEGLSVTQLMYRVSVQGERPPIRPEDEIPLGIQKLIKSCWSHDPALRPDFPLIVRALNEVKQELNL